MVEDALPDWVREKKQVLDKRKRDAEIAREVEQRSNQLIQLEGPNFWNDFAKELTLNLEASKELGVIPNVEKVSENDGQRVGFNVSIHAAGSVYRTDHFSVYYQGTNYIEIHRKNENPRRMALQADPSGKIWAISSEGAFSAPKLAEHLVQSVVNSIID